MEPFKRGGEIENEKDRKLMKNERGKKEMQKESVNQKED